MNALMSCLSDRGIEARQRFNISEVSYRSARSTSQRLFLRFRQYILYPIQIAVHLFFEIFNGKSKSPVVVSTTHFSFTSCDVF